MRDSSTSRQNDRVAPSLLAIALASCTHQPFAALQQRLK
jgi:hypothetical protein